jgi:tRNA modification GTPase
MGDPLGRAAQRAARAALEACDVIVWCDPSGRFDESDLGLQAGGRAVIRVRTKADLALGAGDAPAIGVCALDGSNLGSLRSAIAQSVASGHASDTLPPRHRAHMVAGSEALGRAIELAQSGEAELIAGELRAALDEIGALVGRISADDVIGRIFSTFCVGK